MFEQFTHAVQCVGQLEWVTEVKHRVGVCVCFYMKCVILKALSIMERSDLCECMLILKSVCEYFWRWVNDRVPYINFYMCSELESENQNRKKLEPNDFHRDATI